MLINSYQFGKAAGGNIASLIQNTQAFVMNNGAGNTDNFVVPGVKVGSTLIVIVHHMMLNGNNDNAIISDNARGNGYVSQVKSICGTAGGLAHKGSVQIHKSYVFNATDLGGATGDVKIFTKTTDANLANIRMHYYALEVSNLVDGNIATTDAFATNVGTNLGNNSPNVFMSGWSQKNTFIVAAATGLQNNQFSFNTSTYPASTDGGPGSWSPLWIKNEASGTATGNTRSISNYMVSSSNAGTLISDWVTAFSTSGAGAPWAAVMIAFKTT